MLELDDTPSHLGVTIGDYYPTIHITNNNSDDEIHDSLKEVFHICVMEYFPCGKVKSPLDYRHLIKRQKSTNGH